MLQERYKKMSEESTNNDISEILKKHGLSTSQLAAKIGVQWTTVDRWVKGKNKPRKSALDKIEYCLAGGATPAMSSERFVPVTIYLRPSDLKRLIRIFVSLD